MLDTLAQSQFILKYAAVFLVGFLTTYLATPLVKRLARVAGLLDIPGERRIHKTPTPRCGISVFVGFHAACATALLFPWTPFWGTLNLEWWYNFIALSTIILAIGLIDDRWSLRARTKLAGQVVVAILAYFSGMTVGRVLGVDLPLALDLIVTVLWFVAIINAFNLIDGMDGLATGLATIACVGIAGSFLFRHIPGDALIVLGLMGSCLAFLRYNFHPASIFLGDSGSMFLGFTLASVALSSSAKGTVFASVFVPLLAIGVPIFDTVLAIWRRAVRQMLKPDADAEGGETKKRIFDADMDHMHHRLLRSGLSHRAAATWLYVLSLALVAVGFLSMMWHSAAVGIFILSFVSGSYVFVRHLARVELWGSALAITQGLYHPPNRVIAALLYPVLDGLALSLSLGLACFLSAPGHGFENLKLYWFDQLPLWVGLPFLTMIMGRTYTRVWSRARVSEYAILAVCTLTGILIASAIASMTGSFAPTQRWLSIEGGPIPNMTILLAESSERGLFEQVFLYSFCSLNLIVGLRALPRVVQDALVWHRLRRSSTYEGLHRALIYGAGYDCTLYLLEQSFRQLGTQVPIKVMGLIDEDSNLKGRYVHGYKVYGGLEGVPEVVAKLEIQNIIVTVKIDDECRATLIKLAESTGVRLSQWTTHSERIV